jgi:glutamyl-tRNA synthetase/glutamyl-Q tRNA(Asp) synthetase
VLLRIEDHDRRRSRRHFEEAILEDLAWLGFEADGPPVRQSERSAIYESALDGLRRRGLVYACNCSRAEVAMANGGAEIANAQAGLKPCTTTDDRAAVVVQAFPLPPERQARGGGRPAETELRYPGTCAGRGLAEGPGVGLRVRLEPSVERFVDRRLGPQRQRPSEQCGDLLVRDRDGNWTYQFAATVDDYVQGVTLVVRGVDLLASTGRQIQLARLLGRAEPPAFLHHPLIMKSAASAGGFGGPSQKLSKSDGDTGVRELRAQGWTPAQVIERALSMIQGRT